MKKYFSIIFAIILSVTCIISLVACNKNGQTVSSKDLGTYYKVDGTDLNPDSFIELKSGNKWYDGEFEGKFTIKDGKITLYDGDDELMSGTVSDGVLTLNFMGMETVYKKGTPSSKVDPTPTPHPSNEFTVTFYLNDGTKNSKTKQTENELITYTPERIGYIFNGWWISSGKTETDEPILTKRWDMSQKVEDNELILYAEWVLAPTQDAQLPAPSVSVDGYRYSWERINNAESYNVILKKGYDVIEEQKTYDTYWNFSQFYESGTYTLSVRANGDGIKSINSSYTTKHISHRILGNLSFCNFDKSTSMLTWGVVEGATSYDVYVDGLCILEDTNEKSYVLTNIDAGKHTVVVKGKKENWQTSYNSYSIYKDMLKTPSDFRSYFDYDTMEYVLEWDSVRGIANSEIVYKVYNGTYLIKQVENNFYKIPKSDWASYEKSKNISVVAFDKNAETIQSIPTDKLEIKKMVAFEVKSNLEEVGTYDIAINASDIKVTFDYNYKDSPDNKIQVLNKDNPAIEYFTPVRDGYVFLGWYKDKQCTKRFDFSSTVKSDITLFALWQDIDEKTTILELNKEKKVYTSKTSQKFTFVPMKAGSFTLGYYNNGSGQRTNINVYQGISTVYAPGYQTSTSWVLKTFQLNAYDMVTISITSTSDNYSGYFTFKMEGDALPDVNPDNFAVVKKDNKIITPVDSELSFTAKPNLGYNCLGWYDNNDKQLSSQADYNTKLSLSSSSYTVKWAINEELKNCAFTSTADTCVITGITDKTITEFVVPDYVTGIGDEAFKDCTKLSSITIDKNVKSIGNSAFEGCYSLIEVYNKSTLKIVAGSSGYGYVAHYAKNVYTQEGGSKLSTDENGYIIYTDETKNEKILVKYIGKDTDLTIPDSVISIGRYAFEDCTGLTTITIPNSVTSIGGSAFYGCSSLTYVNYTGDIAGWCAISGLGSIPRNTGFKLTIAGQEIAGELVIPAGVTSIGSSAFNGCTGLSSVTIGNSVTSIDSWVFDGCKSLVNVNYTGDIASWCAISGLDNIPRNTGFKLTIAGQEIAGELVIPAGVTSIGSYAFAGCTGLTSVIIPDSVTSIGSNAFSGCPIEKATIPTSTIVAIEKGNLVSVVINGGESIPNRAFEGCTGLTSVTIGNSVTSIGTWAFRACTGLTSITIPDSVTSIGYDAFAGCTGLTSVTIGNSVTSIGSSAFEGCTGLTSVTIGNSVTSIGTWAFRACTGLTSITIPNSVTSIGAGAFEGCNNLETVNWNATSCTSAGQSNYPIFKGCSKLSTVNIGNNVKMIPAYAFMECTRLTSVTIGNSVTSIGTWAFRACTGLISITIPDSVTSIGYSVFLGCLIENANMPTNAILYIPKEKLAKVVINGGESIGSSAFEDCEGLTSVTIGNSVTSIGSYAFEGCKGLTSITIPDSVTSIGDRAFYNCTGLTSITIGNSVTSIGEWAFSGCTGLTSVTIGNSVTSIGEWAFSGCTGLTSVTIGNSVKSIGKRAFNGCTGLTSVTIGNSVASIGDSAFYKCEGLTSVTIPDSVTSIRKEAFSGCTGLTSATIGNSVKSIGDFAFRGCTGLTSINFKGTKAEWSSIKKGYGCKDYVPSTCKVVCTDGTVSI